MDNEILDLYNQFTKIHNQFNAIKRSYKLPDVDIYPSELQVLALIQSNKNITISDIAKKFYMTKSASSQAVKKLSKKGLIHKSRSFENERHVILEITKEGMSVLEKFFNDSKNPLNVFMNRYMDLPESDLKIIKRFIIDVEEMFEMKLM